MITEPDSGLVTRVEPSSWEWSEVQEKLRRLDLNEPSRHGRGAETGARLVASFEELCESFHLVYEEYLKCGFIDRHPSGMRYHIHQVLPVSQSFIAYHRGSIAGTGSIVLNSPAGLPSTSVFRDVFSALEREGRRVAEGTMLACRDVSGVPAHRTAWELIAQGIAWSLEKGVDDFCIVVNPRHFKFWHQTMGFEVLGEERPCKHVKSHPGVLLRLDLKGIREHNLRPCEGLERVAFTRHSSPDEPRSDFSLSPDQATFLLNLRPELLPSVVEHLHAVSSLYHLRASERTSSVGSETQRVAA